MNVFLQVCLTKAMRHPGSTYRGAMMCNKQLTESSKAPFKVCKLFILTLMVFLGKSCVVKYCFYKTFFFFFF